LNPYQGRFPWLPRLYLLPAILDQLLQQAPEKILSGIPFYSANFHAHIDQHEGWRVNQTPDKFKVKRQWVVDIQSPKRC
jgi:hypothetical protein